jgi:hypothetical protein
LQAPKILKGKKTGKIGEKSLQSGFFVARQRQPGGAPAKKPFKSRA